MIYDGWDFVGGSYTRPTLENISKTDFRLFISSPFQFPGGIGMEDRGAFIARAILTVCGQSAHFCRKIMFDAQPVTILTCEILYV